MSSDNTKANWKYHVGNVLAGGEGRFIITMLAGIAGAAAGTGITVGNMMDTELDQVGTENQTAVYQELSGDIQALELAESKIGLAEKQHEINFLSGDMSAEALAESAQNVADLKKSFAMESYGTLLDLYNSGTAGQEADLSEAQFIELHQMFNDKVADTDAMNMGMNKSMAAYLDEARIDMGEDDAYTGNPIADAQELQSRIVSMESDEVGAGLAAGMIALFAALFFGMFKGEDVLRDMARQPKRVPRRRKSGGGLNH